MKYIYKHGNQFWYQRAIPTKAQTVIGKKSIKISLKTNKISTAVQRSKLQALEHTKMFKDLLNKTNYLSKVFYKKNMDIKKYELSFLDDYEDFVTKIFFSKKMVFEKVKQKIQNTDSKKIDKIKSNTIENFLFKIQDESNLLSVFLKKIPDNNNFSNLSFLKKNLKLLIQVCGDKPLNEYNSNDYEKFNSFLVNNNLPTKEILKSLHEIIYQGYESLNIKEKINFKKQNKNYKPNFINEFNNDELSLILKKCKMARDLESLLILLLMDTGCTFAEISGLDVNDIYLDSYLPFLIIRSNSLRKIKNLNKLRTVPLVGISLWSLNKINDVKHKNENYFLMSQKKKESFRTKVNLRLREIIPGKSSLSFKKSIISRLVKINCPERVILDIIGQSKKNRLYKDEISLEIKASWLKQISKLQ